MSSLRIGHRTWSLAALTLLAALVVPAGQSQDMSKLVASDGDEGDFFGGAVALSGDRALIASPQADGSNLSAGAVYVFEYRNGGWGETARLTASQQGTSDLFGTAVALSGKRALIGAPQDDDRAFNAGAVYVFEWQRGEWVESSKLIPGDATSDDKFGRAVAVDGNRVVVGSGADNGLGQNVGAAYVFELQNGAWVETAKLVASDGQQIGFGFGVSAAISGSTILIGAQGDNANSGAAYVFEKRAEGWVETQKLVASDNPLEGNFGVSVSLSNDRVLIGNSSDSDNGSLSGAAYVFEKQGGLWTQTAKLKLDIPLFSLIDALSAHVNELVVDQWLTARQGNKLIGLLESARDRYFSGALANAVKNMQQFIDVAAQFSELNQVPDDLAQSLYDAAQLILASDVATNDVFGRSLVLSGDVAFISAGGDDTFGESSGAVYAFTHENGSWVQAQKMVAFDGSATSGFGSGIAVSEGRALIGASGAIVNGVGTGAAYVYEDAYAAHHEPGIGFAGIPGNGLDQPALTWGLGPNYPNPFTSATAFTFTLPEATTVHLSVYDVLGREVAVLVHGFMEAGLHKSIFDAGAHPNGMYLLRMESPQGVFTRNIVLVRN